jgi:uncharacterized protein (TIGR03067 family)
MPTLTFAGAELARVELERLQGAWTSIAGRHDAEFLIAGNLFTVKFLDGKIYMGTLTLDATEQPREMLMRIDEGPIKHKGKFSHCIYELDGDTLRWCPTEPGSEERLTGFPPVDDNRYLCTVFQRQKPRPRA